MPDEKTVAPTMFDLACDMLRKVGDMERPTAELAYALASQLDQLRRDPTFVLPAAEAMLRSAGVARLFFLGNGSTVLAWPRGERLRTGETGVGGETLDDAFKRFVRARKAGGNG